MQNPFLTPLPARNPFENWPTATWAVPTPPPQPAPPADAAFDQSTGEAVVVDGGYITRDALLLKWQDAQAKLEEAKAREMMLRKLVVAVCTNPDKKSGTERVELGNGWQLKTEKTINYKLKSKVEGVSNFTAVLGAYNQIRALSPDVADKLVKWDAKLSVSEYRTLTPEMRAVIDNVLITDDGAPTVEIIPPKEAT